MTMPPTVLYPRLAELPALREERVLALDCQNLLAPKGPIPLPQAVQRASADLCAALLADLAPERIVLPLFAGPCDAMTVIEQLQALHYTGKIVVIAPPLPRPDLVERELRAAGPGARLTLVTP
jgi:hypothetical protein